MEKKDGISDRRKALPKGIKDAFIFLRTIKKVPSVNEQKFFAGEALVRKKCLNLRFNSLKL